jgi:hypothetical protein
MTERRDSRSSLHKDPESLQVAQVMFKLDPVRIWRELKTQLLEGSLGGPIGSAQEILQGEGQSYTEVARGEEWLVECAIRGLTHENIDSSTRQTATQNLRTIATYGPDYGSVEEDPIQSTRLDIFGPREILWDALERLTRNPDDQSGIVQVIKVVLHQAMHIADLFIQSWQCGESGKPSYK